MIMAKRERDANSSRGGLGSGGNVPVGHNDRNADVELCSRDLFLLRCKTNKIFYIRPVESQGFIMTFNFAKNNVAKRVIACCVILNSL